MYYNIVMQSESITYLREHLTYSAEKIEPWQVVENAVTELLLQVIVDDNIPERWQVRCNLDNSVALAIVHSQFEQEHSEFLDIFLQARLSSLPTFKEVVKKFANHGFPEFSHLTEVFLPIVCFSINSRDLDTDFMTTGFTTKLKQSLSDIPYWKASSHLIFGDNTDPEHDFPSYARNTANELDLSLIEFLTTQTSHENFHLIIDAIIGCTFAEYATWLQEGACELLTGMEGRALNIAKSYKEKNPVMSIRDVLNNSSYHHRYGGGFLLVRAIAHAYEPVDLEKGLIQFLRKLYDSKTEHTGEAISVSEATMQVLTHDGLLSLIEDLFEKEYNRLGE